MHWRLQKNRTKKCPVSPVDRDTPTTCEFLGSLNSPPRHRGNSGRPAPSMYQTRTKPYQRTLFLHAFFIWKTCDLNVNKNPTLQRTLLFPRFYHANRFFLKNRHPCQQMKPDTHLFSVCTYNTHTHNNYYTHVIVQACVCLCVPDFDDPDPRSD